MSSQYDYIVIDCDFGMQKDDLELYSMANEIILVGDGSEISNDKTVRAIASIQILEQEKICLFAEKPCFYIIALIIILVELLKI